MNFLKVALLLENLPYKKCCKKSFRLNKSDTRDNMNPQGKLRNAGDDKYVGRYKTR